MAKCDVCGKTSFIPEKFGTTNICKLCFMKANGILWKRQYDRHEDAEKQRCKAIESAHQHNFPQHVVSAINDFFIFQMNSMLQCDGCSQSVQNLQALGKANLCKQCFGKINVSAWKETEYEDNEKVEINRKKVLKIASKNGFSPIIIEGINMHFDSKLQKGLISSLDNHRGQKLNIFETHCILTTTDHFDIEENSKEYGKVLRKSQSKGGLISSNMVKSLANGVLSGGIVKAGINLATSAAINAAADAIAPSKEVFKVIKGKYKIDYLVYDQIDFQKKGDNEIGFIRFRNSKFNGNQNEDIVFIFGSSDGKEKAYNEIIKWASITQQSHKSTKENQSNQNSQTTYLPSVADEILKFKNLLDMGVITQEEFERKKKDLLEYNK